MKNKSLAKPVGINHISLVVGNIAEAVAFYGGFLDIEVVYEDQSGIPRSELASIEMGDQFIALTCGKKKEMMLTIMLVWSSVIKNGCVNA